MRRGGGGHGAEPVPAQGAQVVAAAGVPFQYLEYGSYLSQWRRRHLKSVDRPRAHLPDGVRAEGQLVRRPGRLIESGELRRMLGWR